MIKIGVLSDSHANLEAVSEIERRFRDVDYIFHLGDYIEDAMALSGMTKKPLVIIKGNCDIGSPDGKWEATPTIAGKKILACHGHRYQVKSGLTPIAYRGMEACADIVLYGHTHCPRIDLDGDRLILNPGAALRGEYAIIAIEGDEVSPELFRL